MNDDAVELLQSLDTLLEKERSALLTGDLESLEGLVAEKSALLDALNQLNREDMPDLGETGEKAARNQALMEQALEGVRSVARHLADLRQSRKTFDTYDRTGQKNRISSDVRPTVEKRA